MYCPALLNSGRAHDVCRCQSFRCMAWVKTGQSDGFCRLYQIEPITEQSL